MSCDRLCRFRAHGSLMEVTERAALRDHSNMSAYIRRALVRQLEAGRIKKPKGV